MTESPAPAVSAGRQVQIEAGLAHRLADAPAGERRGLYGRVYDEIYAMHLSRDPDTLDFGAGPELLAFLVKHTCAGDDVLEVGCGAGLLGVELARQGRRVLGIDVSARILEQARVRARATPGVSFARTEGTDLPAPDAAFDFVYSVEVLEHLHAEDVASHLREIYRVLRPGGRYWLLTPNRLDTISSAERFGVAVDVEAVST